MSNLNDITESIIGCAIKLHKRLGPGLLESAYEECLNYELIKAGHNVIRQKPIPLIYEDIKLECGYRLDILVDNLIIVEIKSIEAIKEIHIAQLLTYLKLANIEIGLIFNFNVRQLKDGIKRVTLQKQVEKQTL